jgi:hypothetical protein
MPPGAQELHRLSFPRQGIDSVYWRNGRPGRYRLYWSDAGTFDLDTRRRCVTCYPLPGASPAAIEEVLRGPLCSFLLLDRGFEPLHAGAVLLRRQCVAFAGQPGAGKSTLIGYLVAHGARFFADDVVALRSPRPGVRAWPVLPGLRLGHRSLRALRWQRRSARVTGGKITVSLRPPRGAQRLGRIFLLERRGSGYPAIEDLRPREAFLALVAHTRNAAETAAWRLEQQLRICGWLANHVPVCRLRYGSGFARLAQVRRAILQDLAS